MSYFLITGPIQMLVLIQLFIIFRNAPVLRINCQNVYGLNLMSALCVLQELLPYNAVSDISYCIWVRCWWAKFCKFYDFKLNHESYITKVYLTIRTWTSSKSLIINIFYKPMPWKFCPLKFIIKILWVLTDLNSPGLVKHCMDLIYYIL